MRVIVLLLLACGSMSVGLPGCEHQPQPGQELFAFKNQTRSWKTPEIRPVRLEEAPRLGLDHLDLDFGIVEPQVEITRTVTLRNEGSSPLIVRRSSKDPSSAASISPSDPLNIDSHREANLNVTWSPPRQLGLANQTIILRTNDPGRPLVSLEVSGQVRSTVAVEPMALHAPRVLPHKSTEMEVTVYSQRWDHFELKDLHSSLEGLTWEVEPAAPDMLQALMAKSGWKLRALLPADLPEGPLLNQNLSLEAVPDSEQGVPCELTVPIQAKVLRRVSVYGGDINDRGTIEFGILPRGLKHQRELTVKVNDADPSLKLSSVECKPEFLQAELKPLSADGGPENLYHLVVTLPPTAPMGVYRGEDVGQVHFKFNHPRIHELALQADFVLSGKDRHVATASDELQ